VTNGHSPGSGFDLRRRLLPAALVVLGAVGAAFVVLALTSGSRTPDPPAAHPLPKRALASEQARHPAGPHAGARPRPRLVNVVDREAEPPRWLRIPAIGVHARVIPLGLNPDGTMQTPVSVSVTGWYKPWREPGERGAAVVTGHVDSVSGPGVFYRLRELERGDIIRIARADHSVVRFRVEGLERWPKAAFPTRKVFRPTRIAALRLVTCSGDFDTSTGHYVDNTIVYAARVRVRRRPARAAQPRAPRDRARRDSSRTRRP
jgi:hypothetical protein